MFLLTFSSLFLYAGHFLHELNIANHLLAL